MPFPCRFRKARTVTKCTNKPQSGTSKSSSKTTTAATTNTSRAASRETGRETAATTNTSRAASKENASRAGSRETTSISSKSPSKSKTSTSSKTPSKVTPSASSSTTRAAPFNRHANCYKETSKTKVTPSKISTTSGRKQSPRVQGASATSSAASTKINNKNTVDANTGPRRSRSTDRQRGHGPTASGKADKTNNVSSQSCRSTGVGDCPACLGAKNECHAEKCSLCCGLKFCGPEWENCPFVKGSACQTEPLEPACESTGLPCECVDTSCNTSKMCILVDRVVFDNVRGMISKSDHGCTNETASLNDAVANKTSYSRAGPDVISRADRASSPCPNMDEADGGSMLRSQADSIYLRKPNIDQLALMLQEEVNRLALLQAEIDRLSLLRSGANTGYLPVQGVDATYFPQSRNPSYYGNAGPQQGVEATSFPQSRNNPPYYGNAGLILRPIDVTDYTTNPVPATGYSMQVDDTLRKSIMDALPPQPIADTRYSTKADGLLPKSINDTERTAQLRADTTRYSTQPRADTRYSTQPKGDTRYSTKADGSLPKSIDDTGDRPKLKAYTRNSTKADGSLTKSIDDSDDTTRPKANTRNSTKTDANKLSLVQPKTNITKGKVETKNSVKNDVGKKKTTKKNSNKTSSLKPGDDPSCCVQAGLPEKCSAYKHGKKRDRSPNERKSNVDVVSLTGQDVEIIIAPKGGVDRIYFPEDGLAVEVSDPLKGKIDCAKGVCVDSCGMSTDTSTRAGDNNKVSVAVPSGKCSCRKPEDVLAMQRRKFSAE